MRFKLKSAAKARAVFEKGLTREEAWNTLTTLCDHLILGAYYLEAKLKGSEGSIGVGDIFKYEHLHNDNSTYYVTITAWNHLESFSYEEKWSPITGPYYDHPSAAPDEKTTTELKISTHFEELVLDVRRTEYRSEGFWLFLVNKLSNSKGEAFRELDTMIGPGGSGATAYAGKWRRLPIHSVIIKPDKFSGPSIL